MRNEVGIAFERTRDRLKINSENKRIQKEERERQEKPLRDAIEELENNSNQHSQDLQNCILHKTLDAIDESVLAGLPHLEFDDADKEKVTNAAKAFSRSTPDYKHSDANSEVLIEFLKRNSLNPEHEVCWTRAFDLLKHFQGFEPEEEIKPEAIKPPQLTRQDIDNMDSTEFKHRLYSDPSFGAMVEAVLSGSTQ